MIEALPWILLGIVVLGVVVGIFWISLKATFGR
jgi:hypothetical protein